MKTVELGGMRTGRRNRHTDPRSRRERGAGLVEYALIVGLVAVAITGASERLIDAEREEVSRRAASAGAPDLNETGAGAATGTSPPAVPPEDPPGSTPLSTVSVTLSATQTVHGSKWTVTVSLTATDQDGAYAEGATVAGTWSETGDTVECSTSAGGVCTMTLTVKKQDYTTLTLTITDVTGNGVTAAQPLPTVTVTQGS